MMAVILCRCRGNISERIDLTALSACLESRGQSVSIGDALCDDGLARVLTGLRNGGIILGGCDEESTRHDVMERMRKVGQDPFSLRCIGLLGESSTERAVLRLGAAVDRLRSRPPVDEQCVKARFGSPGGRMSRRQLLTLARVRYDLVPYVDAACCRNGLRRCSLCVSGCARGAIRPGGGAPPAIDKERCSGCGLCVHVCPSGAIVYPGASPREVFAEVAALLERNGGTYSGPMRILFSCESGRALLHEYGSAGYALPEGIFPVYVPCAGALSARMLAYPILLGAEGVGLLVCPRGKCRRATPPEWAAAERLLADAVGTAVCGHETTVRVFAPKSIDDIQAEFASFTGATKGFRTSFMPPGTAAGEVPGGDDLSLRSLLCTCAASPAGSPIVLRGYEAIRHGRLRMDDEGACTFCGVCGEVCPTGAVSLNENSERQTVEFNEGACVGCGECMRKCPEKVLFVEKVLDTDADRHSRPTALASDSVVTCADCGRTHINASLLRKLTSEVISPETAALLKLCPDCRSRNSFLALW